MSRNNNKQLLIFTSNTFIKHYKL